MTIYRTTRPLVGHLVDGGEVHFKIGAEISKRADGKFETNHYSAVTLCPPTVSVTKLVFNINAHIAATDLERA